MPVRSGVFLATLLMLLLLAGPAFAQKKAKAPRNSMDLQYIPANHSVFRPIPVRDEFEEEPDAERLYEPTPSTGKRNSQDAKFVPADGNLFKSDPNNVLKFD